MIDLNQSAVTFDAPSGPITIDSVPDAQRWVMQFTDECKDIEAQLALRNRTHADGSRMTSEEYWAWRDRAVSALRHKQKLLSRIKAYVRAHNVAHADEDDRRKALLRRCLSWFEAEHWSERDGELIAELIRHELNIATEAVA